MAEPFDPTLASDTGGSTAVDGDESYCAACGGSYPLELDVCPKDGARLTKLKARPDALLGRVFDGRFEVRMALGQGGMGTVYRGWQLTVDREIAIKVIHPKLATDRVAVKRFLREARLSSRLNQPNIVNVYDFGQTDDGILFIAMELLRGHTLARELEAMKPLPLRRTTTIAMQLCDALDAAHAQGIIHRDLKPGNVIILDDPPGRDLIKVLDFGLAKSLVSDTSSQVTHTNAILGTPLYMAPEQVEGRPADQRADLYALGCILYQMVTGRPPFVSDSVNLVLAAHLSEEPEPLPPDVPAPLADTIRHLLAKDPARRLASARAAREAIQGVVDAGLGARDLADTTPEIRSSVVAPPLALARTDADAAAARPHTSPGQVAVRVPTSPPSIDQPPPRTARWILPLLAISGLAALGAGAYVVTRTPASTRGPAATPDARAIEAQPSSHAIDAPMPTDASVPAVTEVDAAGAEATVIDAGTRERPRPKPPKPRARIDAGTGEPSLEFLPTTR